jgi:hypothetical protein
MAEGGMPLWLSLKLVTSNPAQHGIDANTWSIEIDKRAFLIAFRPKAGYAEVSHAWIRGDQMPSVAEK